MSADWVSFFSTLASVAVTVFSIMFLSLQVRSAVWRGRRLLHVAAIAALVEVFVPMVASLIVAMGGHRWHWAAWVAGGLGLVMVVLHWGFYARERLRAARGLPLSSAGAPPHVSEFEHHQAIGNGLSLLVYGGIFVSPWVRPFWVLPPGWGLPLLAGLCVWLLFSGSFEAWWLLEPKEVTGKPDVKPPNGRVSETEIAQLTDAITALIANGPKWSARDPGSLVSPRADQVVEAASTVGDPGDQPHIAREPVELDGAPAPPST
jgi:hypothetical protein